MPDVAMPVMAAKKPKKPTRLTKKDLETKIKALESKIEKMAAASPTTKKPAPTTSPPPPPPPASPRGSLPKGTVPQTTQTQTARTETKQIPTTVAQSLEDAYQNAPITDTFGELRAKIAGYTPAPSRYFTRNTAPVGTVPTSNWNLQKATVTGYTQPSNQYFATRQRLAYHPPEKRFTGYGMRVNGSSTNSTSPPPPSTARGSLPKGMSPPSSTSQSTPPPPPPPPSTARGSLPKGMSPPSSTSQSTPPPPPPPSTARGSLPKGMSPPPAQSSSSTLGKGDFNSYEENYLKRLDADKARQAEIERVAAERLQQNKQSPSTKRGALPKGF